MSEQSFEQPIGLEVTGFRGRPGMTRRKAAEVTRHKAAEVTNINNLHILTNIGLGGFHEITIFVSLSTEVGRNTAKVFSCPLWEMWKFSTTQDFGCAYRLRFGYAIRSGSRSGTPYQAECGVLSVVY